MAICMRNLLDEIIIRIESTFLSHYKEENEEDEGERKWEKK